MDRLSRKRSFFFFFTRRKSVRRNIGCAFTFVAPEAQWLQWAFAGCKRSRCDAAQLLKKELLKIPSRKYYRCKFNGQIWDFTWKFQYIIYMCIIFCPDLDLVKVNDRKFHLNWLLTTYNWATWWIYFPIKLFLTKRVNYRDWEIIMLKASR